VASVLSTSLGKLTAHLLPSIKIWQSLGCGSAIEVLPGMHKTLGLIASTTKKKKMAARSCGFRLLYVTT
jgi:hypothetical protein